MDGTTERNRAKIHSPMRAQAGGQAVCNLGGMLARPVMAQGADVEEAGGTDSSGDKDDKKNNKFKCRVRPVID